MAPFNKHSVNATALLLYISTFLSGIIRMTSLNLVSRTATREGANDKQNNSNNISNENNITVD